MKHANKQLFLLIAISLILFSVNSFASDKSNNLSDTQTEDSLEYDSDDLEDTSEVAEENIEEEETQMESTQISEDE